MSSRSCLSRGTAKTIRCFNLCTPCICTCKIHVWSDRSDNVQWVVFHGDTMSRIIRRHVKCITLLNYKSGNDTWRHLTIDKRRIVSVFMLVVRSTARGEQMAYTTSVMILREIIRELTLFVAAKIGTVHNVETQRHECRCTYERVLLHAYLMSCDGYS